MESKLAKKVFEWCDEWEFSAEFQHGLKNIMLNMLSHKLGSCLSEADHQKLSKHQRLVLNF